MKVYLYVLITIILVIYGQIAVKQGVGALLASGISVKTSGLPVFIIKALLNPWVLSGFVSAFLGALVWLLVLQHLELSRAYPFVAMIFVLMPFACWIALGEGISPGKIIGSGIIALGIVVSGKF